MERFKIKKLEETLQEKGKVISYARSDDSLP